jgi:cell division septum initiation protein DivIVA
MKNVIIIDNTLGGLEKINEVVSSKGNILYIMKGIFTEFNIRNRNDRIYTAEKFLPHLSELLERKKLLKVVYGEFDHPDVFDTSLTRISHTIQNAWFIKETNRVDGEIKLTNTFYGKEAQALVDDDLPIFVSSRAAGVTESNGEVTIKKLFTYDCVADPGFSSARMELKNMNESLGFNENLNFRIFDISEESKINELFNMEKNEIGTQTKLEEFKSYLDSELLKTKNSIEETLNSKNFDPEKLSRLYEEFETLSEGQKRMAEYLDQIADAINVLVQENKQLKKTNDKLEERVEKNKEKTKLIIEHNDHIAEAVEKTIGYIDYLAGTTDQVIDYQKYIAEKLDNGISFIEYVAEQTENTIKYSEYIAENFDKIADYADYIAEHLDKNIMYAEYVAETVDNLVDYADYISESAEKIVDYTQYIAEHVDNAIRYGEYVAEQTDNGIRYSEMLAENLTDSIAYQKYEAEVIDRHIDYTKRVVEKLGVTEAIGDMTTDDPSNYYEDKPEEKPADGATEEPKVEEPAQETPPAEEKPAQEAPVQGETPPVEETPAQDAEGVNTEEVPPQEETGLGITPGMIVTVKGDKDEETAQPEGTEGATEEPTRTGEVLATDDTTKIVVVKMGDTGEEVEVEESRLTILGTTKIYENTNQITKDIKKLIEAAKKREAAKTEDPHFLLFLPEKKKAAYYGLTPEDKEKVNFVMNENKGNYSNESDVLILMQKALFKPTRSLNETLVENIPSDLQPIWEKLNPKVQESILDTAQFYTDLTTEKKVESFWLTRDLLQYAQANTGKKVLNENINTYDNYSLSDEQVEHMKNVLNRY